MLLVGAWRDSDDRISVELFTANVAGAAVAVI